MSGTVLVLSQLLSEVITVVIPILQMRNLRLLQVK